MDTQNTTSELASHALATLAGALEAGNSAALTAFLAVPLVFVDELRINRAAESCDIVR